MIDPSIILTLASGLLLLLSGLNSGRVSPSDAAAEGAPAAETTPHDA